LPQKAVQNSQKGGILRVLYPIALHPYLWYIRFMKYIPKLYLETTVFNFYYVNKDSKKKNDTHKLFDAIKKGKYEVYTSVYVQNEIADASPEKYRKMQGLLEKYVQNIVFFSKEGEDLADVYMANGIIPLKYDTDASDLWSAAYRYGNGEQAGFCGQF
jgi:predicted nucleic acid-binding protein